MRDPNYFMSFKKDKKINVADYNYVLVQHLFILYKDERIFSLLNENNHSLKKKKIPYLPMTSTYNQQEPNFLFY